MIINTDEIKDLFYKNLKNVRDDEMVHIDYVDEAVFDLAIELVKKLNIDDVRLCFPTDEDIEDIAEATIKEGGDNNDIAYWERTGFMDGAKWVIQMIKNRNKWN